ncbi:MAG: AEC family transporter [Epsilonproteobacteria bacterium]|nr:AEC family transporter [Campylobacterota bacterium]
MFLSLSLGYLLARAGVFKTEAASVLNQYVITIALPAMVLLEVPKISFSIELLGVVSVAWIAMGSSALMVLWGAKRLALSREVTGSLMLVAVLTNSTFLGIPIIQALLGAESLGYIMVYDQLGTFIALATYGTFVAALYSSSHAKADIKGSLLKVVKLPPFIAFVIALLLDGSTLPQPLQAVLHSLSLTIVPLALVAVGLQLQLRLPRHDLRPFTFALFVKLLFSPLIALIAVMMIGLDGIAMQVSVLEAAMAPMITAGVLASNAGLAPRLSSAIVGYGIIFSLATSLFWYALL